MSRAHAVRSGTAASLDSGKTSVIIIPRSKNVCLHRHFCEAVNVTGARSAQRHSRKS